MTESTAILAAIERGLRTVLREELARALSELHGPELLTTAEAARRVGVRPKTIRVWVRSGRLPRAGPGRRVLVRREDLDAVRVVPSLPGDAAALLRSLPGGGR